MTTCQVQIRNNWKMYDQSLVVIVHSLLRWARRRPEKECQRSWLLTPIKFYYWSRRFCWRDLAPTACLYYLGLLQEEKWGTGTQVFSELTTIVYFYRIITPTNDFIYAMTFFSFERYVPSSTFVSRTDYHTLAWAVGHYCSWEFVYVWLLVFNDDPEDLGGW